MVARLLATAALWVQIQTAVKNTKWATQAKKWQKKCVTLHRGASSNFLDSLAGRREGRGPECLLVKKRNSWSTHSAVLLNNLVLNHQVRVKK